MGTRNLTIVQKDREYKVAQYGQWDGYPEGLGVQLLIFLKRVNMHSFKECIDKVSFYTQEELEKIENHIETMKRNFKDYDWTLAYPELSRDWGGDVLQHIIFNGTKKLKNSIDFAAYSLYCEWAYVIDLDSGKFEVYDGYNKEELSEGDRFYFLEDLSEDGYHPVKLRKSYDIDNLPDEDSFVADFVEDPDF